MFPIEPRTIPTTCRRGGLRAVAVAVTLAAAAAIPAAGCGDDLRDPDASAAGAPASYAIAAGFGGLAITELTRERVVDDVYHYELAVRVGTTPHAVLRLHRIVRERAPWQPRPTPRAIMLLHGDFSTFASNFAPTLISDAAAPDHGLAVFLARRDLDVWGVDRRWTQAALDDDLTDLGDMTFAAAVADTEQALLYARWVRALGGAGWGRLALGGFSRGAQLTYATAGYEATLPAWQRQVDAIVPLDIYARLSPEDADLRQGACDRRDEERAQLAAGELGGDDTFFSLAGELARAAPDDESPLFGAPYSNRDTLLTLLGQTYFFFPATPAYHLAGAELADDWPVALRFTDEALAADWFAAAPPWQAMAELADGDAMWCGDEPSLADHLEDVTVPVLYVGAAGGFGDHGLYTTAQLGSTDVTTRVVRTREPGDEVEDIGHGDLVLGRDAPTQVWGPVADWLRAR